MRFVILLLIFAAGAAFLTKPSEADVEEALREQLIVGIATEEIGAGRGAVENIGLAACKLRPNECFELLRSTLEITYTDMVLFLKAEIAGQDAQATCYGAYTTLFCPSGFKDL